MKVAAHCPGDRWFLSWLSFNFPHGEKSWQGFARRSGPTVFTDRHTSLPSHPEPETVQEKLRREGADVWNRRFSLSCWLLSLSAGALFIYFFFFSQMKQKTSETGGSDMLQTFCILLPESEPCVWCMMVVSTDGASSSWLSCKSITWAEVRTLIFKVLCHLLCH